MEMNALRFGDVAICVASLAVVVVLIFAPLEIAVVSVLGLTLGPNVTLAISYIVSALIVGYIFAEKLQESRVEGIAKTLVLAAAFLVAVLFNTPSFGDWNPMVKEAYQASHPGITLSASEWVGVEDMALAQRLAINTALVLVLGFIGLYIGSMLKKPAKNSARRS